MMEENVSIEKLVVAIKNGGSRVKINKFETRNKEIARRKKRGEDFSKLLPTKVEAEEPEKTTPAEEPEKTEQ